MLLLWTKFTVMSTGAINKPSVGRNLTALMLKKSTLLVSDYAVISIKSKRFATIILIRRNVGQMGSFQLGMLRVPMLRVTLVSFDLPTVGLF